ncbi:hypothetical protein Tco_1151779, partial [Tanacetum coccineum]
MWLKWPMLLGTLRFSVRGQVRITRETVMGDPVNIRPNSLRVATRKGYDQKKVCQAWSYKVQGSIKRCMNHKGYDGHKLDSEDNPTEIRSHDHTKVCSTTGLLGLQVKNNSSNNPPSPPCAYVGNLSGQGLALRIGGNMVRAWGHNQSDTKGGE